MKSATRVLTGAHRVVLTISPTMFTKAHDRMVVFRSNRVHPGDVLVASYPRSGNTWLRFMLCATLGDSDRPTMEDVRRYVPPITTLSRRTPSLVPGARFVKIHEPPGSVASNRASRMLYLVRDVRNVALSYHKYRVSLGLSHSTDFRTFLEQFLHGTVDGYGSWKAHVEAALVRRQRFPDSIYIIRYEDLVTDTSQWLRGACSYVGAVVPDSKLSLAVAAGDRARAMQPRSSSNVLPHKETAHAVATESAGNGTRSGVKREDEEYLITHTSDVLEALGYAI